METFGQEVKNKPSFSDDKINKLRYELIREELDELKVAMENKDLLEVADALTDILYVTYGAGHAFGIDLDKCFEEVQSSNMSKLDESGEPIYNEAGKVMKGPKYFINRKFMNVFIILLTLIILIGAILLTVTPSVLFKLN